MPTLQPVVDHFGAEQEEIRSAAAFAAGNIAIGNLQQFLPAIVEMMPRFAWYPVENTMA